MKQVLKQKSLRLRLKSLSKNILLQLLILFVVALNFGSFFPLPVKTFLYNVSLSLQSILIMALPVIIFGCIYNCMLEQKGKALGFVFALFVAVALANACSALFAYGLGTLVIQTHPNLFSVSAVTGVEKLSAMAWALTEPFFKLDNRYPLSFGLVLGLWFVFFPHPKADEAGHFLSKIIKIFLKQCFTPVLPLFTFGFMLNMQHTGMLSQIVSKYLPLFLLIFAAIGIYLILFFALAAAFKPRAWFRYVKNLLPAGFMGFSTMSSLATMPLTLEATDKNTEHQHMHTRDMAKAIIPATVNIHLVGNSIATIVMVMVLLLTFGKPAFTVPGFLKFLVEFVQVKFAVAAIPAGGIIVMLPVLKSSLFFTEEMAALITSLYILLDPLITAGNILGNGAFALIFPKLFKKLQNQRI
ncbi:MAG: cation:dicarboxylate symporter family transporter [Gammaproteobacteria bacterium]